MTRDALTVRRFPSPSLLAAASLLCACAGSKPTPTAVDPAVQANAKPAAAAEPVATQSQPAPQVPTTQDAPLQKRFALENRLDVVALRHAPDVTQSAELALLLPGGSETSRPGSAELAAHLLAHLLHQVSGFVIDFELGKPRLVSVGQMLHMERVQLIVPVKHRLNGDIGPNGRNDP